MGRNSLKESQVAKKKARSPALLVGLSRIEKAFLFSALLGMLSTGILLFDEPFHRLFSTWTVDDSLITIGQVIEQSNDTRLKRQRSFAWLPSYTNARVLGGDSVFTGQDSSAKIALHSGESIILNPNSLVSFREVSGVTIPQLDLGVFQIEAKGKVRVAIRGQVTEIVGKDSRVEIQIEPEKPVLLRVTQGTAVVKPAQAAPQELTVESKPIAVGPPVKEFDFVETQLAPPAERPQNRLVSFRLDSSDRIDTEVSLRLYDIYDEPAPNLLVPRIPSLKPIESQILRTWIPEEGSEAQRWIQVSPNPEFDPSFTEQISDQQNQHSLKHVWPGDNFWRLSSNGVTWSNFKSFKVALKPLPNSPQIPFKEREVVLSQEIVQFVLKAPILPEAEGYLLETSSDPQFPLRSLRVTWSPSGEFPFEFNEPGIQFHRLRFFNAKKELSPFSEVFSLLVKSPPLPELAPVASSSEAATPIPEPTESEREPSSISKETSQEPESSSQVTRWSRLSIEGSMFSMLSSHQVDARVPRAAGAMSSLSFQSWWANFGFDARFKSKILSSNETAKKASPRGAEVKVLSEAKQPLSGTLIPELSWLFFAGIELYRNPDAGNLFSPQYDLIKGGIGLRFPAGQRVTTGGDLCVGLGTERSRKYELAGFLDYHLNKKWSLGAGYRLHLFDSQSVTSSPTGAPHREAYTEGFSALKWSY